MFAEDISEDVSEERRYHFYCILFRVFPDIFEIFAEDCFLLRGFRKFLPSAFLPLSPFQIFVVKNTGRGLVVKRPGVLSKVQILGAVFGGGDATKHFSVKKRGFQ